MSALSGAILIVDDEEADRILIESALRVNQVTAPIRTVGSGKEAIDYLRGEGKYSDREEFPFPSFISLDLRMPEVDGFKVLEHIRTNIEWDVIPVSVLSGSEDLDDVRQACLLGATSYHLKPRDYQELCEQMKAMCENWMRTGGPTSARTEGDLGG